MSETPDNFLGLPPEYCDPTCSRYAILPLPYEGTVSYKGGTAAGPAAIIDASKQVEKFDEELCDEYYEIGIATYPAVTAAADPAAQMKRVKEAASAIIGSGKFLLSLGGEHSLTAPLVEAVAAKHGPISVLQIDAHADLRDTYGGCGESHACVMRRILKITHRICQVGIRSVSREEYDSCQRQVANFITPTDIACSADWIERAMELLGDNVYLTIDIDGFDPALAPGTGTPEPGGLSWQQVLALIKEVACHRRIVAADIMEVRPIGPNHITEYLAARLAYKIIAYTQQPREKE